MSALRILGLAPGVRVDCWLSPKWGDEQSWRVPGGRIRVTSFGESESGIHYTHVNYEPLRAGLVRFGEGPKVSA